MRDNLYYFCDSMFIFLTRVLMFLKSSILYIIKKSLLLRHPMF